jgi:hypothetical protein
MKSQSQRDVSLEEIMEHIKKNFETDKNWEKLMKNIGTKQSYSFN